VWLDPKQCRMPDSFAVTVTLNNLNLLEENNYGLCRLRLLRLNLFTRSNSCFSNAIRSIPAYSRMRLMLYRVTSRLINCYGIIPHGYHRVLENNPGWVAVRCSPAHLVPVGRSTARSTEIRVEKDIELLRSPYSR
jgi:hypothetical protein